MNLSLNKQDLKQLETEHFITIPYENREFIIMDKQELEKAKNLDLLYIDFLQKDSKGLTTTLNTDEDIINFVESL